MQAFLATFSSGSFTAAARELGISQPSLSELVRRLEQELETKLFRRCPRRLTPTIAGEELYSYAVRAVNAASQGVDAVRSLRTLDGGTVTFGLLRNADFYHLADFAKEFYRMYPRVRIRLVGQNSAQIATAVVAGEVEAALVTLPVDETDLSVKPLIQDEIVFVTSDAEAAEKAITAQQFAERKLVLYDAHYGELDPARRQLAQRTRMVGAVLSPIIEVEHLQTALSFVAEGICDTLGAREAVAASDYAGQLHVASFDPPMYDVIALIRRRDRAISPATQKMARLAEEIIIRRNPSKTIPI